MIESITDWAYLDTLISFFFFLFLSWKVLLINPVSWINRGCSDCMCLVWVLADCVFSKICSKSSKWSSYQICGKRIVRVSFVQNALDQKYFSWGWDPSVNTKFIYVSSAPYTQSEGTLQSVFSVPALTQKLRSGMEFCPVTLCTIQKFLDFWNILNFRFFD